MKKFAFLNRYFISIPYMKPGQRHLYRVSSIFPRTGSPLHPPVCLTCSIVSSSKTGTDENGYRTSRSSSIRQNGLINRNEWHDHYETQTDNIDNKEHHQAKDIVKKDKLKSRNISSEYWHYCCTFFFQFRFVSL